MTDKLLDNEFAQVSAFTLNQTGDTNELPALRISHGNCQAQVSLYGGQVLRYEPKGHKDVLWVSDDAHYQSGKAIRGGIPLCWPWFGANDKPNQGVNGGNHGFARQLLWQVSTITADKDNVVLTLVLAGEKQHPLWPNAYKLVQTLVFGKSFKQTLSMSNLSSEDAQYSAALHSYFSVSNPEHVAIDALTGVSFDDKLTATSSIQQSSVSCVGEIDREYHSSEQMSIVDNEWQRKIEVSSSNCQQWVLWNPGTQLANTMADVHAGGEHEYVCLEAANTKWQTLPAGKTVIISQDIQVSSF